MIDTWHISTQYIATYWGARRFEVDLCLSDIHINNGQEKKNTQQQCLSDKCRSLEGLDCAQHRRVNAEDMLGMKNLFLLTCRLVLREQNYLKYEYTALSIRR